MIKIEDPASGGDVARYVPPFEVDGDSLYFQSFNHGKKSVALDLRSAGGLSAFHDLVRVSDAVYNNLRGDLPARLGLTFEGLRHLNPGIVCCSLSGFGSSGPRASEPGYDSIVQALAGYMSVTGEPGGPPAKCGVSVIDFASGLTAGLGLVSGVLRARSTGVGCNVEVSLLGTAISMLTYLATWSLNGDWGAVRQAGSGHQTLMPSGNFETADGWLTVFCAKEKFWRALVERMGAPELGEDVRFATFAGRERNREALFGELSRRFRERRTVEWVDVLSPEVPCAPVNDVGAALGDPQVAAMGMLMSTFHPVYGEVRHPSCPIRIPGVEEDGAPGPGLGEHTDEVLRELPGYDV